MTQVGDSSRLTAPPDANSPYEAPVDEIMVALEVAGLGELLQLEDYRDFDRK